jgi:hypothetical protein
LGLSGSAAWARLERGDRLVVVALELKRPSPDRIGDGQILAGHLGGRNHRVTGGETRLGLGLRVAAGVHVIGQRGACDRHQNCRYEEGAQHLKERLRRNACLSINNRSGSF